MKKGISLMSVFVLCFIIPSILQVSDVFILFAVLVWFYSFFHARNLVVYSDEEFYALPDTYIWSFFIEGKGFRITNPTVRKWGGLVLIVYGLSQLWRAISRTIYYLLPEYLWELSTLIVEEVPRVFVAVVIIIFGFKLIVRKKKELTKNMIDLD